MAQRLKSNIDLLRSTGSVSWSAIWQFLKLNDAVDIVDVESRLSHETEKLKADYGTAAQEAGLILHWFRRI